MYVVPARFEKEWDGFHAILLNSDTEGGSKLPGMLNNKEHSSVLNPPTIVCCGHSLGGALATLCTEWIKRSYAFSRVLCVTFGSPRVGCQIFLRKYHMVMPLQNHFRVEHDCDPITKVPCGLKHQYRHVGQKVSSCKADDADHKWSQVMLHHGTEQGPDVHFAGGLRGSAALKLHNHSMVAYTRWLHDRETEWLDEFCNSQRGIEPGGEGLTRQLDGGSILSGM